MRTFLYEKGFKLLTRFSLKYENISKSEIEDIISETCFNLPTKILLVSNKKNDKLAFIVKKKNKKKEEEIRTIENMDGYTYEYINSINGYIYMCIDNAIKKWFRNKQKISIIQIEDIIKEIPNNTDTNQKDLDRLQKCFDMLREKDQYLINWNIEENKRPVEEVAKILNIESNSVYKASQRAKKRLKKLYNKK